MRDTPGEAQAERPSDDARSSRRATAIPINGRSARARLIEPSDPAWNALLAGTRHDFYHLPAYTDLEGRRMGGIGRAILVEDDEASMLLPVVIRPLREGLTDATSPYGYPGPILRGAARTSWLVDAWRLAMDELEAASVVSLFVRTHPLLTPRMPPRCGIQVRHADSVVVDLSRPEGELWEQTRRDHRKQIRQARERGYVARWVDPSTGLATFERLYAETMERKGASDDYAFDDAYLRGLALALGDRLRLAVVSFDGVVVAAGLWVTTCGIVESYLSATRQDRPNESGRATKLMYHFVRGWAARTGHEWLHLGGGMGATEDSLHYFKAGFSPSRRPYWTIRAILDPHGYERLVATSVPELATPDPNGYFPAYRIPVGSTQSAGTILRG